MNLSHDEEILQLKAAQVVHTADQFAIVALLDSIFQTLRPAFPDLPDQRSIAVEFSRLRNDAVHKQLEHLELQNPGRAAQLQALIDEKCTRAPFDYE